MKRGLFLTLQEKRGLVIPDLTGEKRVIPDVTGEKRVIPDLTGGLTGRGYGVDYLHCYGSIGNHIQPY